MPSVSQNRHGVIRDQLFAVQKRLAFAAGEPFALEIRDPRFNRCRVHQESM
jgi:hypothetical protein